jgi:hypothetical protein
MTKHLYQVEIKRTTYQGESSVETRELFAKSSKDINTYRLGGFQRDSIEVLKATKLRPQRTIEVDIDFEWQNLRTSISVDDHLNSTLEFNEIITKTLNNSCQDYSDVMESLGYFEVTSDNSYNYSSDFENELQYTVYSNNPKDKDGDWYYSKNVVVLVSEHTGLDVRGGYRFRGAYNGLEHDSLHYFLEQHVRIEVISLDDNGRSEPTDTFEGTEASYRLLQEYVLVDFDEETQDVIVCNQNGELFKLSFYCPAMGV